MKNLKFVLSIAFISMLLAGCQKYAEVKPEFYNFTKNDEVSLDDFLAACTEKETSLNFQGFNYEDKSFQRAANSTLKYTSTYEYENSKTVSVTTLNTDNDISYQPTTSVYSIENLSGVSSTMPESTSNRDTKTSLCYQITNGMIVLLDKNNKIYQEIDPVSARTSFGNFIRQERPISQTYLKDNINYFNTFARSDYPTRYYVTKKNIFTSAINYDSQDGSVEGSYSCTLTVTATAQIYVKSNSSITINTKYDSKEVRSNFTKEYAEANKIKYKTLTIESSYLSTDTLTIGGIFISNPIDIRNYSRVDSIN